MAENPLLPHAELVALLGRVRECIALEKSAAKRRASSPVNVPAGREALLAATAMQLLQGDLLLSQPGDVTAARMAPAPASPASPSILQPASLRGEANLLLAAGLAAGMRLSGSDHLVLTILSEGSRQIEWTAALRWAQEQLLPLVIVCTDPRGLDAFTPAKRPGGPERLHWSAMQTAGKRLGLPIMTVDGEDAVAVYRVMQESVLRARSGGGPAVLWAMLPSPKEAANARPGAATPLGRLRSYLRARRIPF